MHLTLYPQVGFEKNPVSITDYTVEDGVLPGADVQPGSWVVYATEASPEHNGRQQNSST